MATYYPTSLPAATDPSLDPAGIGLASTKVNGGAVKPRPQSLYADELKQIIYTIVGLGAALGLPDGSTPSSIYETLSGLPAGPLIDALSSGELVNPTDVPINTALDLSSGLWRISFDGYYGLPDMTGLGVHVKEIITTAESVGLVPFGYPAGTDTVNGGAPGAIGGLSNITGLHYVIYDGAGAWYTLSAAPRARNNLTAVVDPGSGNDNLSGYSAGSIWLNTVSGGLFVCTDASTAAALWPSITTAADLAVVAATANTAQSDAAAAQASANAAVQTTRAFTTTAPLTIDGGGSANLSADRTLAITAASAIAAGSMSAADFTAVAQLKIGVPAAGYRAVSGNITIDSDDNVLAISATADITLPAAATNRIVRCKKTTTSAITLRIIRAAAEQIEGVAATYTVLEANAAELISFDLWCDGTNWWIL